MAAACNLKIELDDPTSMRVGGEPVTGTVIVTCTGPVKCDGLDVKTYWMTHGRGNIASGDVEQETVFTGQWDSGQEYRYKFSLKSATWPPTYYGTYLNVSHGVKATARIPWSSDPKTDVEFRVVAANAPEDLKPTSAPPKKVNFIGWILGMIIVVILLAMFSVLLLFLVPILGIGWGGWWFFRVFLPRQVTGSIDLTLEPKRAAPGETIHGQLRFTPKRNMTINSINWTVSCVEECVSGSGSNRSTHRYELLKKSERLAEPGLLRVGMPQAFDFSFAVPENAPPSMKFTDNALNWTAELRIDIAKWPDWVKSVPLTITPSTASLTGPSRGFIGAAPENMPTPEEEAWFYDVLGQILQTQEDPAKRNLVIDAVRDHVFSICIDIIEHLDEPPATSREPGPWIIGSARRSELEIALLWTLPGEPPEPDTYNWCGKAMIIGYDEELESVLMRVV